MSSPIGLVAVRVVLMTLICAAAGRAEPSVVRDGSRVVKPAAEELFALGNEARANHGARPLEWDADLAASALRHCLRMAAEGSISHRYAGEADLTERAASAGAHFSMIEENVAMGPYTNTIHEGWMHSTGHRENLLNPAVDRVGIAVVASQGTLFAVVDFAHGVAELTPAQVESAVARLVRARNVSINRDPDDARRACERDKGVPAMANPHPRFIMRWQSADLNRLPAELDRKLDSGEYRRAAVGACTAMDVQGRFTSYRVAVLLY